MFDNESARGLRFLRSGDRRGGLFIGWLPNLGVPPEMIWRRETEDGHGVDSAKRDFCRHGEGPIDFKSLRRIGLRLACFECIDEQCGRVGRLGGAYDF